MSWTAIIQGDKVYLFYNVMYCISWLIMNSSIHHLLLCLNHLYSHFYTCLCYNVCEYCADPVLYNNDYNHLLVFDINI